jgi:peptidoglycan/xylan/chitin deacetylase (PgdA/CDA1 family)
VLLAVVLSGGIAVQLSTADRRGGPHDRPVPILMYHVVGAAPSGTAYPDLYVPAAEFRAQLDWIARHGYHPVTQQQVYAYWRRGTPLPSRPIVLSFDDGYPQDVDTVLPLLRTRHWPAVLNLQIGNLVPARVRELMRAGWEIDAHTFTHPDLTTVDPARLRHEVADARVWIQRVFHVPVLFFCYPAGKYDAAVVAEVRKAGYVGATTTQPGLASPADMFALPRIRVDGGDGASGLASKLRALGEPA